MCSLRSLRQTLSAAVEALTRKATKPSHNCPVGEHDREDQPPDTKDRLRQFAERTIQLSYHPAFDALTSLLRIPLPSDLGLLFEMSARSYNARPSLWYPALAARGGSRRTAYEDLHAGVQEGLRTTYYHLQNFLRIEEEVRRLGSQLNRMAFKSGASLAMPAASLNSEWESFTFMSRATLDRLAVFIRRGLDTSGSRHNLVELRTWLEGNRSGAPETIAYTACIARHREYLDTQMSPNKSRHQTERDRLAHFEYIDFAQLNLIWMFDGTLSVWTSHDIPSGQDAGKLLTARFYELADLVIDLVVTVIGLPDYWARTAHPKP